jgi:hypothetical protein
MTRHSRPSRVTFTLPQEPNEGSRLVNNGTSSNGDAEEAPRRTLEHRDSSSSLLSYGSTNSTGSGRGWRTLREYLAQGDLALKLKEQTATKRQRTRSSIRREVFKEFHSGISFTIEQCLMAIVGYVMISIPVFSFLLEPQWTIVDSSYFAVTTFTTLGYGDLTPTSSVSRHFTAGYAVLGIITLGLALGSLGNQLIEKHQNATSRAQQITQKQIMSFFNTESSASGNARAAIDSLRNSSSSTATCSITRANIFQKHMVDVSRLFILVVVMLVLAFWIGYESGWGVPDTIYYLIITGKNNLRDERRHGQQSIVFPSSRVSPNIYAYIYIYIYIFKNQVAPLAMATLLRPHKPADSSPSFSFPWYVG